MKKTFGKIGERLDRGFIAKIYDKITKEKNSAWLFITLVLILGGFGVLCCLIWFGMMLKEGMPLWAIIFDLAIICFCCWAVVKAIIPMSKKVYDHIDKMPDKVTETNDKVTDS